MKLKKRMICLLCAATITASAVTMFGCQSKEDNSSSSSSSSSSSQSESKNSDENANKSEFRSGQLSLKLNIDEKKALYSQLTEVDDKGHLFASLSLIGAYYQTDEQKKAIEEYNESHKRSDEEKANMENQLLSESDDKDNQNEKKPEYPKDYCDPVSYYGEKNDKPDVLKMSKYTEKDGLISAEKEGDSTAVTFDPRKQNNSDLKTIANLMFVSEEEYKQAQESKSEFKDSSGNVYDKKIAEGNGLVCLANMDIPNITFDDLNSDAKDMYNKLKNTIENAESNGISRIDDFETAAKFYENGGMQTDVGLKMPSFEAESTDGKTVSNKDFANKDLTMINIWDEDCGPCISELPDLEKLSKEVSSNVQVMGMIIRANSDKSKENVRKLIEKAGTSYKQFFANDQLDSIASSITGTPTTFFVDKNGNMVGDPVVGVKSLDEYKQIINERLSQLNG